MTYIQSEYDKAINQMKEIVSGKRGWMSLTVASRESGVPKNQIRIAAESLGLKIENSYGRYGMTASL